MFARNVLLTYLTELIGAGFSFLTGVLLARGLSPADRGVMVLVMTLPNLMFNLLNLGLHESTTFFIGRKKADPGAVLVNALALSGVTGAAAFGLLALFRAPAAAFFTKGLPGDLWLPVALLVPAALVQGLLLSMLRAKMRFARMNAWRLVASVVTLAGFGIALFGARGGLRASVLAYFWITLPLAGLAFLLVAQIVPLRGGWQPRLSGEMLRYGLKSYAQGMISGMNYRLDVYLVALFLQTQDVAFYGIAFALAEIAWFLPNAAGTVLFPRLANAPLEDVHRLTAAACRTIVALTALTAAGVALVSPLIPIVYGAAYWRSIPPLLILLPGVVLMAVHKVLGRNFASRDRQQYTIAASLVSFFIILILDLVLIPRLGVEGAALASSLGYCAAASALIAFFVRDSGLPPREFLIITRADMRALLAAARGSLPGLRPAASATPAASGKESQ